MFLTVIMFLQFDYRRFHGDYSGFLIRSKRDGNETVHSDFLSYCN